MPRLRARKSRLTQWTAGRAAPISTAMANRLLLTLLALLTGLAAQMAPAQARVCPQQASAVAVEPPAVQRAAAVPAGLADLPEAGRRHARLVASEPGLSLRPLGHTPTVRIGIDRART